MNAINNLPSNKKAGFSNIKTIALVIIIITLLATSIYAATYVVLITSPTNTSANPVRVNGTWDVSNNPQGQLDNYNVEIDWGDGTNKNVINIERNEVSNPKHFWGTFDSNPGFDHTYSMTQPCQQYNITVKLYHGQTGGAESGNSTVTSTITVKTTFYQDLDGDGYGNPGVSTEECSVPVGYVTDNTDCDDTNSAIKPGVIEVCDGIDNDCNDGIDEGDACSQINDYYCDNDSDTYISSTPNGSCSGFKCIPTGCSATQGDDCNDNDATINPNATETCNNVDDNCVGGIDESLSQACGSNVCLGTQTCSAGAWSDCSTKDSDAGTCAICNATGTAVYDDTQNIDCNGNDLAEINTCTNTPDGNSYTLDFASAFDSQCSEIDSCTTGSYSFTHTCNKATCNAPCLIGESQTCFVGGYQGTQSCTTGCTWDTCATSESCGDNIMNGNEDCDSSDLCCDQSTCKFISAAVECRAAGGLCDVADYCTGTNAACPSDSVRPDGYVCAVESVQCDADDTCNGVTKVCNEVYAPLGTDCNDGLFCSSEDQCDGSGVCVQKTAMSCSGNDIAAIATCDNSPDDNIHFTWDSRNSFTSICDETNICPTGDSTINHQTPTIGTCGVLCLSNDDCNSLDNNYCDGTSIKHDEGKCVNYECTTETTTVQDCNNNLYCDGAETCSAAACVGGTAPPNCEDAYSCTDDSCNEAVDSCDNAFNDASCVSPEVCRPSLFPTPSGCGVITQCTDKTDGTTCDDGIYCNGADDCQGQVCTNVGLEISVDDGVVCTVDSCDETNHVMHTPDNNICSDGLFCNGAETCNPTLDCQAGTAPDCTDTLFCTVNERCDETNKCTYDNKDCSGNNIGGIETCGNDPDDNPLTWDYRNSFTSTCDEIGDVCTSESETITHTCDVTQCGATCDSYDDCLATECDNNDGCYDGIYRDYSDVNNNCLDGCSCEQNSCATYTSEADNDNDGYSASCGECNDANTTINPGATETCDGLDNNCDNSTDEGFTDTDVDGIADCVDLDDDNDGDPDTTDCDDVNASINHNATEICDGIDNNCDGSVDEGGVCVTYTGGGDDSSACHPMWNCDSWSECQPSGVQTRTCTELQCEDRETTSPITERQCRYVAPSRSSSSGDTFFGKNETPPEPETPQEAPVTPTPDNTGIGVTGAAIGAGGMSSWWWLLIILIVILGLLGAYMYYKNRK